jgi:hypothetical protein
MSSLNATARKFLNEIIAGGVSVDEIVQSWVPLPKQCSREDRSEIEAERRDLSRMLTSLLEDDVRNARAPLRKEVARLGKIVEGLPALRRIRAALHEYGQLGSSGAEVAALTGLDEGAVSRLRNRLFQMEYGLSFLQKAAALLEGKLPETRRVPATVLVASLPLEVVDADSQAVNNAETRAQAAAAIRHVLVRLMGHETPLEVDLPPFWRGALARVGECCYVFVLASGLGDDARLTIAHELRHIADRIGAKQTIHGSDDTGAASGNPMY